MSYFGRAQTITNEINNVLDLDYYKQLYFLNLVVANDKETLRKELDVLKDGKRNELINIYNKYNLMLDLDINIRWTGINWSVLRPKHIYDGYIDRYGRADRMQTFTTKELALKYYNKWYRE